MENSLGWLVQNPPYPDSSNRWFMGHYILSGSDTLYVSIFLPSLEYRTNLFCHYLMLLKDSSVMGEILPWSLQHRFLLLKNQHNPLYHIDNSSSNDIHDFSLVLFISIKLGHNSKRIKLVS
jgi:hypothetical protein